MITSKNFICPNCGKAYSLHLPPAVSICCAACGNVYTVDINGSTIDEEMNCKILPDENSLIILGATGLYNNDPFTIIGRIRSVNTLAISNEWVMWFEKSNTFQLLIESGLTYFVFSNKAAKANPNLVKNKAPGAVVNTENGSYAVVEATKQIQFKMEGEIPEDSLNVSEYFKVELSKPDGTEFASVCLYSSDVVEISHGKVLNIIELGLSTIDKFKDWK